MPDLLFELGCEELPASAVRRAYEELAAAIGDRLTEKGIAFGEVTAMGTPRRLIVGIGDVSARQPDSEKESRGPGLAGAFSEDGTPTKALEGFCRGQGVSVTEVEQRDGYVWVRKFVAGQSTQDLLPEILESSVRSLKFDKSMRWGASRMRFARPIRWILAAFDRALVPMSIEGVSSGTESRGHRFYAPDAFHATSLSELIEGLRTRKVEPDASRREKTIRDQAQTVATGTPDLSDELVDENVFLTEWPTAVEGSFNEDFLVLPDSVLVTAMAKHERFFPVRDSSGRITNRFVSIRNAGQDAVVSAGNAWVLNARFNDAKFFYDEDQKSTLDSFLNATERMTFQEKLGSVRQRADRLAKLAALIAPEHAEHASTAAKYAKADLSTGLVNELSSLQGIVGGGYARREGLPEPVAAAIGAQYDLRRVIALQGADRAVAAAVLVADQIDKLVGYLGIGLAPSGTSDPFGLRRCVTYLIQAAWEGLLSADIEAVVLASERLYLEQNQPIEAGKAMELLKPVFLGRYEALMPDVRYDIREAATLGDDAPVLSPTSIRQRVAWMNELAQAEPLVTTLTRPVNLAAAAIKKNETIPSGSYSDIDRTALDSEDGVALLDAIQADSASDPVDRLRNLQPKLNAFFESTMIMAEQPATRGARLLLVKNLSDEILSLGDLTKLVFEGTE